MKRCSCCRRDLAESRYSPDWRVPLGLQSRCKECRAADQRRYYALHAEEVRARARAVYAANPEPIRAEARRYANSHRAERAANRLKWGQLNRDYLLDYMAGWRATNRVKTRFYSRQYDHRRRSNGLTDLTFDAWSGRLKEFGDRCAYCATTARLEMDHITSVAKGGTHTLDNVVPACQPCNRTKRDKAMLVFLFEKAAAI